MNLLRAKVKDGPDWWEAKLLDLDIAADGASEDEMLRQVEYALVAEYHLALKYGQTPFVKIFTKDCPEEVRKSWEDGSKNLRTLNLPDVVRQALAAVFRRPSLGHFELEAVESTAA